MEAILGAGGLALASVAGLIPRVGLGRALSLGYKSYFKTTYPLSVRESEIEQLNDLILRLKKGRYIVVTGGKGNGKSCLIDTTLNHHFGVVKISTKSGASKSFIVDQALSALTGIESKCFPPVGTACRLLFFYSFLFKRPPIMVIRVHERQSGQNYADLPAAVRELADDYGLRVIVDGPPNSFPPELLATKREMEIAVELMSKEQIESIPELKVAISTNLSGGSPVDYLRLEGAIIIANKPSFSDTASDEVVNQVKFHLLSILSDALSKNVADSSLNTKQIIKIFRERKVIKIPVAELAAMGLLLDYPNEVFREVKTLSRWFVEPSSPAVSLIISENVKNDVDVDELRDKLFKAT
eukprot:gene26360-34997_t